MGLMNICKEYDDLTIWRVVAATSGVKGYPFAESFAIPRRADEVRCGGRRYLCSEHSVAMKKTRGHVVFGAACA